MRRLGWWLGAVLLLTACAADGNAGAVTAVQDYLQAQVAGDADAMRGLVCAAQEGLVETQALSFASVNGTLENPGCTVNGTDGDYTRVTCTGVISATYGLQQRELPLGSYRAVEEGGAWRFCGEANPAP